MSFEVLETITKMNAPPVATLSYLRGAHKNKVPKADIKPSLRITVPTTIVGVSKSKSWFLLMGSGDHEGKLRLVGDLEPSLPHKNGGAKVIEMKHAFRWTFGYLPRFGEEIFDAARWPVVRINDEIYEITMPIGFFAASVPETPAATSSKKGKGK